MKKLILTLAIIFSLGACSTQIDNTERLSIAKVQKEIKTKHKNAPVSQPVRFLFQFQFSY